MVDSVIVTFADKNGRELLDVSLPCNLVIGDMKNQLRYIRELSLAERDFSLIVDGKKLDDNTSLSDNGIWDGSIIKIETEGSKWHF